MQRGLRVIVARDIGELVGGAAGDAKLWMFHTAVVMTPCWNSTLSTLPGANSSAKAASLLGTTALSISVITPPAALDSHTELKAW